MPQASIRLIQSALSSNHRWCVTVGVFLFVMPLAVTLPQHRSGPQMTFTCSTASGSPRLAEDAAKRPRIVSRFPACMGLATAELLWAPIGIDYDINRCAYATGEPAHNGHPASVNLRRPLEAWAYRVQRVAGRCRNLLLFKASGLSR